MTTSSVLIEERLATDPELTVLLDAAFQELVSRYGAEGRSHVHDGARFLVARVGGQTVGCGALQPTEDPATTELKRMYVLADQRGRGIASALLSALETMALDLGYQGIRLATGLKQPEAMALYTKRGSQMTEPYGKYTQQPLTRCYYKAVAG